MRIQKKCKTCDESFIAIKTTQLYCKRRCFKRSYYLKNKDKLKYEEEHPRYPQKTCTYCKNKSDITFDPIKYPKMFDLWTCPFCNVPNRITWEYHDTPNSFQKVTELFGTIQILSVTMSTGLS